MFMEGDPSAADTSIYQIHVLPCGDVDPASAVGTGLGIADNNEWLDLFPYGVDTWRYRGAPGDGWITMIIDSMDRGSSRATVVYISNGSETAKVVEYLDTDATYASGKICLGHEDRYGPGSENLPDESFILFDNLTVCELDAPVILASDGAWALYE